MVLIQLDRDTGQHPRMARWLEDQTGVGLGRDEKDVGVRSFKLWCGREKVARLAAAAGADKTHAASRNFIFDRRRASMGCANSRMVYKTTGIVQQSVRTVVQGPGVVQTSERYLSQHNADFRDALE